MKSVESLFKEFNKQSGMETAKMGVSSDTIPRLPSGIFQLDLATGGGFPRGRISVVFGPESSAKTTVCLKLIAQAQRLFPDKKCVFVDAEGHFDAEWAGRVGVNVDTLGYVIPSSAEKMVDMVEALLYAPDLSLIIVDSLAALVSQRELDSDADKAQVGTAGLLINKFYRKTSRALGMAILEGKFPTLVCVNQIRFAVGTTYGNPEVMPGGPSFKFASSMTIRLYGKDEIDKEVNSSLPAYKVIHAVIKKHKVPIVAQSAEFKMAVIPVPHHKLGIGQVYEWGTVQHYLKALGYLAKNKLVWELVLPDTGEILTYKALYEIEAKMRDDLVFASRVKNLIFSAVLEQGSGKSVSDEEDEGQNVQGEEGGVQGGEETDSGS